MELNPQPSKSCESTVTEVVVTLAESLWHMLSWLILAVYNPANLLGHGATLTHSLTLVVDKKKEKTHTTVKNPLKRAKTWTAAVHKVEFKTMALKL